MGPLPSVRDIHGISMRSAALRRSSETSSTPCSTTSSMAPFPTSASTTASTLRPALPAQSIASKKVISKLSACQEIMDQDQDTMDQDQDQETMDQDQETMDQDQETMDRNQCLSWSGEPDLTKATL